MSRVFTRVGVVGVGTMGAGIAEVLARAGIEVVGVERDADSAAAAVARIEASAARAVAGGKLTEDERTALLARGAVGTDLAALADCELVIEAVPERIEDKTAVLRAIHAVIDPEAILTTTTSALSVTELAVASGRPARVVGLHWFNPAPVRSLVEVVDTALVDAAVVAEAEALVEQIGGRAVRTGDRTGFMATALLYGFLNNALNMYAARYATREDIDAAMRFGTGHPIGPLALLDLIGLDAAYDILDAIHARTGDHLHAPAPILKQLVMAGMLGRKSGRGIYTYNAPGSSTVTSAPEPSTFPEGTPRDVRRIGVVGTGTMAGGIVEVCAGAGYDVVFRARSDEKVAGVLKKLTASLDRQVQRGRLTEEARDEVLGRVTGTTELSAFADVDLVIEAVVEDLTVKQALFAELDAVCRPGAILATTTSSLPVIACAKATSRPQDVVGMHWFNPAPAMKLVEVVPTALTDPDVVATIRAVSVKARKHPVLCGDRAGFIVNALIFPYLNDAIRMLADHYATADDMDAVMTVGCGHPMGPFALLDVVGLDVSLAIEQTLYAEFREPGLEPAPLLEHLVAAGYLGRKTGRGFRDYSKR